MLYAWEMNGGESPIGDAADGLARLTGPEPRVFGLAETLAKGIVDNVEAIDRQAAGAADNWRITRMAVIERNILRLGVHELREGSVPPKVAIDEAVRLAHWFGGTKAPAFINGVLDRVAHSLGRL
jgi:N utilization substance protein B